MTHLAIDRAELESIAQQMESGMIVAPVLAKELREVMAKAPAAAAPDLVADMILELRSFGHCRGPVHGDSKKDCSCRLCKILRRLP